MSKQSVLIKVRKRTKFQGCIKREDWGGDRNICPKLVSKPQNLILKKTDVKNLENTLRIPILVVF